MTTVLVDEVMSEGDEDSMSCFSQPERVRVKLPRSTRPMIPLDSGTGTFVEIMVLVGENRMRCQSVKVKVSNSLWHFMREG